MLNCNKKHVGNTSSYVCESCRCNQIFFYFCVVEKHTIHVAMIQPIQMYNMYREMHHVLHSHIITALILNRLKWNIFPSSSSSLVVSWQQCSPIAQICRLLTYCRCFVSVCVWEKLWWELEVGLATHWLSVLLFSKTNSCTYTNTQVHIPRAWASPKIAAASVKDLTAGLYRLLAK